LKSDKIWFCNTIKAAKDWAKQLGYEFIVKVEVDDYTFDNHNKFFTTNGVTRISAPLHISLGALYFDEIYLYYNLDISNEIFEEYLKIYPRGKNEKIIKPIIFKRYSGYKEDSIPEIISSFFPKIKEIIIEYNKLSEEDKKIVKETLERFDCYFTEKSYFPKYYLSKFLKGDLRRIEKFEKYLFEISFIEACIDFNIDESLVRSNMNYSFIMGDYFVAKYIHDEKKLSFGQHKINEIFKMAIELSKNNKEIEIIEKLLDNLFYMSDPGKKNKKMGNQLNIVWEGFKKDIDKKYHNTFVNFINKFV